MPATPDVNLYSFNGPHDNGRYVDWRDRDIDGTGFADALKCSTGLTEFSGSFGRVISGTEDAIDINNRCDGIVLHASAWVLRGKMGITIKGGSRNVSISGVIEGHGREADVDLGNWSDQSHEWVTNTRLNLRTTDGSPVRVRVLAAEKPIYAPGSGPYEWVFPSPRNPFHKALVKTFMELRRNGCFR